METKYYKWALGGLAVLWLLFSTPIIIGPGEVGVVTQFGRVTGREMNPGLNIKAPWPFQGVEVFDTRIQKEQVDAGAASSDLQEVRSTIAVNYHLERGKVSEVYQNVGTRFKDRLIDPAIQEAFKATTAQFNASELLTKRPEVKERARKVLEERLHPRGIRIDDVSIVSFDFSDQFNKAIEEKQVAQQQVLKAQQDLERVKFEAEQKIAQAKAEAESQRVQKETITAELLQLRWIEKWDGKMPQYAGEGAVPFLQLNK